MCHAEYTLVLGIKVLLLRTYYYIVVLRKYLGKNSVLDLDALRNRLCTATDPGRMQESKTRTDNMEEYSECLFLPRRLSDSQVHSYSSVESCHRVGHQKAVKQKGWEASASCEPLHGWGVTSGFIHTTEYYLGGAGRQTPVVHGCNAPHHRHLRLQSR